MLATLIIVFREVIEAALVLSIVAAATKGVAGRNKWLVLGVLGGIAGAALVAVFAGTISESLEGVGQEVFNASVLFVAVIMLAWHNVWMSSHGRELAAEMKAVGHDVSVGTRPLYAVAIVVGMAILREGSEVVLFLYGIASGGVGASGLLLGGAIGVVAGAALGFALYFGLLNLSTRHLFSVTSWMILLLAAGMAAQGANFLTQAGLLPSLGTGLWDTSAILPDGGSGFAGIIGQTLHTLVGYTARPSGIQLVFYVGTLILIGGAMKLYGNVRTQTTQGSVAPHPAA
ncbi:FTR1 family protein [Parvibaculum sp.]|uniref:FTR1 family iron permease n=1 Tax=Parvibaculum sp. TaxID=2024848 RepID=UPI00320C316A